MTDQFMPKKSRCHHFWATAKCIRKLSTKLSTVIVDKGGCREIKDYQVIGDIVAFLKNAATSGLFAYRRISPEPIDFAVFIDFCPFFVLLSDFLSLC
jgi:hypothetical protein